MLDLAAVDQLRALLARHVGQPLTVELCQLIDATARAEPDLAIDVRQFEPQQAGDATLQVERFEALLEELEPLHAAHWQETEKHRHGLALRPNYALLLSRERSGGLLQFTARRGGQLVGHVRMYVQRSVHTSTLYAEEDTLFIRSSDRGGFLAVRLLRYVEQCLKQIGVKEIRADSKLVNKADVLMRRLGYRPVALKFHKFIED